MEPRRRACLAQRRPHEGWPLREGARRSAKPFARRYLALESRRFGDRLDARFEVNDAALDARLPPMTLQPLVENAVRHGIAPLEEGGAVTVRAEHEENDRVRVSCSYAPAVHELVQ